MSNVGDEIAMRKQLASSVKAALELNPKADLTIYPHEVEILIRAADLVTLGRTAVMRDRQGNVIDAHAPEAPTRFVKQLTQVIRGALALDMPRERALHLALRVARDSMPPMRLACLLDVGRHPMSLVSEICKRLDKPRSSIDRELQALQQLGLLSRAEIASGTRTEWRYTMRDEGQQAAVEMLSGDLVVPSREEIEARESAA
jgi:DNA-binding MarR family transcriptional regulator